MRIGNSPRTAVRRVTVAVAGIAATAVFTASSLPSPFPSSPFSSSPPLLSSLLSLLSSLLFPPLLSSLSLLLFFPPFLYLSPPWPSHRHRPPPLTVPSALPLLRRSLCFFFLLLAAASAGPLPPRPPHRAAHAHLSRLRHRTRCPLAHSSHAASAARPLPPLPALSPPASPASLTALFPSRSPHSHFRRASPTPPLPTPHRSTLLSQPRLTTALPSPTLYPLDLSARRLPSPPAPSALSLHLHPPPLFLLKRVGSAEREAVKAFIGITAISSACKK